MKNQSKKIYQFKITLEDITPPIWRRIHVRSDASLHRLSSIILLAMGWGGGHLRQFEIDGKSYGIPDDEFESEMETIDERKIQIDSFDQDTLKTFIWEYDYGDSWRHKVELEDVLDPVRGQRYPKCINGARNCPPDDCGGTPGYENFLNAIRDPRHPEHESMVEWIGHKFDPESFNLDFVNSNLRDVARMEKVWWGDEQE